MKYGIFEILTLIGSLGLFLFGMKLMSDSLQKVAGDKMRSILSKMTSNRIKGVFTGFIVTSAIQSSSATTVMVVSFVNAGLLSLLGAIGVIMGANIGTTVTAWIISLLGFKISMSAFSLPLIAVSLPLLFSRNSNRHSWGELIIGFAILFLGLQALKEAVPDIRSNPEILEFVANYTDMGFWSVLLFLGIGTLLTIVVQSSSATMALTLVMCNNGWISFEMAAAMVLGENIGTTITANLAALIANASAKRAAMAHLIFNVFGVIWMLFVFKYFLIAIDDIFITGKHGISLFSEYNSLDDSGKVLLNQTMPIGLSIFHTAFNIINTLVLIGFAPFIAKIVTKIISTKSKEKFRLKHINSGYYGTAELGSLQAKKEIIIYGERSKKMFEYIPKLINDPEDDAFEQAIDEIEKYEKIGDNMEIEISQFLVKISESELSLHASTRIRAMHKIIDNIESIFDAIHNIGRSLKRKKQEKIWFTPDLRDNLNKMSELLSKALEIMVYNLSNDYSKISLEEAEEAERKINEFRDDLKLVNIKNFKQGELKYKASVIYNDMISYFETMGDHIINVSEAIAYCKEE